ncbi:MAG: HPr(Ser) kinase/phosphatase [Candidatus Sumerlaeota bacterium]|nr:HPr(Ser) kinase/phosphatase [Candidatus Sumerlaeota bacterium]
MTGIAVGKILEKKGKSLELSLIAGNQGLEKRVESPELNRPGLAIAGFYDVFSHDRIQILGITECSFLKGMDPRERQASLTRMFEFEIPCFIITSGQDITLEFLELADRHNVPIMKTPIPTSRFSGMLSNFLEMEFAPSCTIHGVLLDVYGMGVLLVGISGVGKSEAALELVERGHRLVADDVVVLRRISKDLLIGCASEILKHHMEIRGLGIVDVEKLYGVGAIREEKKVSLLVLLEKWDPHKEYERLGMDEKKRTIFDVEIPEYQIPVEPGRNLAILIEVAALQQRLRYGGYNPATEFSKNLLRRIQENKANAEGISESRNLPIGGMEGSEGLGEDPSV